MHFIWKSWLQLQRSECDRLQMWGKHFITRIVKYKQAIKFLANSVSWNRNLFLFPSFCSAQFVCVRDPTKKIQTKINPDILHSDCTESNFANLRVRNAHGLLLMQHQSYLRRLDSNCCKTRLGNLPYLDSYLVHFWTSENEDRNSNWNQ